MKEPIKIGIITCGRYRSCAAGKCLKSLQRREGAFSIYKGKDVELVGITSCGGCPGGNIEYAPEEMKKNGAQVVHFATGMLVGYPPCPRINFFRNFIHSAFQMEVVVGTHPIPKKYFERHNVLKTWDSLECQHMIRSVVAKNEEDSSYD